MDVATNPIVLLFDIDGTLIDSAGAGGGALLAAMIHEFGLSEAQPVSLHGRTDLGIMTELLESHAIAATTENMQRLCDLYFASLPGELQQRQGDRLPGVEVLLQRLAEVPHCHLGVLTGNMPTSARLKLEYFGLWKHFEFGIYGDLAIQRPHLAGPALERIGVEVAPGIPGENIVIVGDTPLDIELAMEMDVRSLAVCTGGYSEHELRAAGASCVAKDLSETDEVLSWMLSTGLGLTE